MWLLRIILVVILLVVAIWVSVQNDQPVDLNLFGKAFTQVPLFLVMLGAALLGFVGGLLISAIREVRLRMRLSQERRDRALLQREVSDLRAAPVQGLQPGPAPGYQELPPPAGE